MNHTLDPRIVNFDPGKVARPTGARQQSPRVRGTKVGDIMSTAVVTLAPDADVLEVADYLIARGTGEVVVVSGHRPLGVLTQRDLIRCWPTEPDVLIRRRADTLLPDRVRRLLPDLDIAAAATVLAEDELDAAPVVDRFGDLIGVLTARHILALVAIDDGSNSR